jgi:pimeloyl-ACP methyl ester carboxylesterase
MLRSSQITTVSAMLLAVVCACSDDDEPKTTADAAAVGTADSGGDDDNDASADAGTGGSSGGGTVGTPNADPIPDEEALPIVFVHGFVGSASQFDSQAIRFVANGYPATRIRAYEHHGLGGEDFVAGLTAFVDDVLAEFDVEKVYLVGHSRGTSVSSSYLETPDNAAKVAKYVALDGRPCDISMAAGVECIAPNQANQPGEKHVEVATSATSFEKMFKFFLGRDPEVTEIVSQGGSVKISGRVVNFPENTGRAGTTLTFWEVDEETGRRVADKPLSTFSIGESGDWGPATVSPDKRYELALVAEGSDLIQHFYFQRFLRDSHLVRLLSGPPTSASRANTNVGDAHTALTLLRMREWTPDDVINISSTSESGGDQPTVNAITDMTGTGSIGFYVHDDVATPGESSLALLPYFSMQPFQMGVDVYMPAADPVDGTVTITNLPRGDASKPQTINVPNWPSSTHTVMAFFADYPQD